MKSKYEPQARYDAENTTRISLKLNKKTDADVLLRLEAQENKQGYIKALIKKDMEGQKVENLKMDEELLLHIGAIYGSECWDEITGKRWNGNNGFQLFAFDHDVSFRNKNYRCVIIRKDIYDAKISYHDLIYSEDIFSDAWEI